MRSEDSETYYLAYLSFTIDVHIKTALGSLVWKFGNRGSDGAG